MMCADASYADQRCEASGSHRPYSEGYSRMAKRKKTAASSHVSGSDADVSAEISSSISPRLSAHVGVVVQEKREGNDPTGGGEEGCSRGGDDRDDDDVRTTFSIYRHQ